MEIQNNLVQLLDIPNNNLHIKPLVSRLTTPETVKWSMY